MCTSTNARKLENKAFLAKWRIQTSVDMDMVMDTDMALDIYIYGHGHRCPCLCGLSIFMPTSAFVSAFSHAFINGQLLIPHFCVVN
jgi:hypothetical protein